MKFIKYSLIGTLSTLLGLTLFCTFMGNPLAGIGMFVLMPYLWLPVVLINSGIICYINKE